MKTTGMVRRVDDLGRVVIPKEIRDHYHIKDGDPLEIFIDLDGPAICFKPYVPYSEPWRLLEDVTKVMQYQYPEYIDEVLAVANKMKSISDS